MAIGNRPVQQELANTCLTAPFFFVKITVQVEAATSNLSTITSTSGRRIFDSMYTSEEVKRYYRERKRKERSTPEGRAKNNFAQRRYKVNKIASGTWNKVRGNRTIERSRWINKPGNKIKAKAHYKVYNAIRIGKLFRKPCEKCNDPLSVAHHDDYSKPLDVRWLCNFHHYEHHKGAT